MRYFLILLFLHFASQGLIHAQWNYEDIISSLTANAGLYIDWKKDATGAYHAAYLDQQNTVLTYAYLGPSSTTWIKEIADPTPNTGYYPSIAIDGNNKPHIAYVKKLPAGTGAAGQILYIHKKSGTWSTPEVVLDKAGTDDAVQTFRLSLQIDATGNIPHLLYYDNRFKTIFPREWDLDLHHAWKSGTQWKNQQIYGTYVENSGYSAFALHPWDRNCCTGVNTQYAPRAIGEYVASCINPTNQRIEIIATSDFSDLYYYKQHPTIDTIWIKNGTSKIDSACVQNPAAIAHCDSNPDFMTNFDVGLTHFGLGYANFYIHTDNSRYMTYNKFRYSTAYSDTLLFARMRSNNSIYRVAVAPGATWNDFYVKGNDTVFVAYYQPTTQLLKFAMSIDTGHTWITKTITSEPFMSRKIAIGYHNNKVMVAYYDAVGQYPKIAYSNDLGNTWTFSYIDFTQNIGSFSDYRNVANDTIQVAFYESTYGDLYYTQRKGLSAPWITEKVDSIGNVGRFVKLQFNHNNGKYPVMMYYDLTKKDLKMAKYNGTNWQISVVDSTSGFDVGTNLSFVIHPVTNRYHVAYRAIGTKQQVWYAYSDDEGVTWNKQIVDSANVFNVGSFISLALDNTGKPHIAYQNFNTNKVKYAYPHPSIPNDWKDTTLFETNPDIVGKYIDLKFDVANNPVIVYYNNSANAVECMFKKGTSWIKERVYVALTSFSHTTLAIAPNKYYIGFYDDFTKSFRVVYRNNTNDTWYQIDVPVSQNIGLIGESSRLKIYGNDLIMLGRKSAPLNRGIGKMYAANGLNILGEVISGAGEVHVAESTSPESNLIIYENYPNPAESYNQLSIGLTAPQEVEISLYDYLGRHIQYVQELTYLPAGTHNITLNTSHLPSGTYMYVIRTANKIYTQKLLIAH
ncbi:MAG: T9SS type A sorting domain-containing protein [Bacteroidia bacterium]|nr:T9SS type A sorting domain-containing protein [Bacteroidia bacterium]MDW8301087.1 T9SS type A sorting domain-containing protein [Bacteroidia bacterium]